MSNLLFTFDVATSLHPERLFPEKTISPTDNALRAQTFESMLLEQMNAKKPAAPDESPQTIHNDRASEEFTQPAAPELLANVTTEDAGLDPASPPTTKPALQPAPQTALVSTPPTLPYSTPQTAAQPAAQTTIQTTQVTKPSASRFDQSENGFAEKEVTRPESVVARNTAPVSPLPLREQAESVIEPSAVPRQAPPSTEQQIESEPLPPVGSEWHADRKLPRETTEAAFALPANLEPHVQRNARLTPVRELVGNLPPSLARVTSQVLTPQTAEAAPTQTTSLETTSPTIHESAALALAQVPAEPTTPVTAAPDNSAEPPVSASTPNEKTLPDAPTVQTPITTQSAAPTEFAPTAPPLSNQPDETRTASAVQPDYASAENVAATKASDTSPDADPLAHPRSSAPEANNFKTKPGAAPDLAPHVEAPMRQPGPVATATNEPSLAVKAKQATNTVLEQTAELSATPTQQLPVKPLARSTDETEEPVQKSTRGTADVQNSFAIPQPMSVPVSLTQIDIQPTVQAQPAVTDETGSTAGQAEPTTEPPLEQLAEVAPTTVSTAQTQASATPINAPQSLRPIEAPPAILKATPQADQAPVDTNSEQPTPASVAPQTKPSQRPLSTTGSESTQSAAAIQPDALATPDFSQEPQTSFSGTANTEPATEAVGAKKTTDVAEAKPRLRFVSATPPTVQRNTTPSTDDNLPALDSKLPASVSDETIQVITEAPTLPNGVTHQKMPAPVAPKPVAIGEQNAQPQAALPVKPVFITNVQSAFGQLSAVDANVSVEAAQPIDAPVQFTATGNNETPVISAEASGKVRESLPQLFASLNQPVTVDSAAKTTPMPPLETVQSNGVATTPVVAATDEMILPDAAPAVLHTAAVPAVPAPAATMQDSVSTPALETPTNSVVESTNQATPPNAKVDPAASQTEFQTASIKSTPSTHSWLNSPLNNLDTNNQTGLPATAPEPLADQTEVPTRPANPMDRPASLPIVAGAPERIAVEPVTQSVQPKVQTPLVSQDLRTSELPDESVSPETIDAAPPAQPANDKQAAAGSVPAVPSGAFVPALEADTLMADVSPLPFASAVETAPHKLSAAPLEQPFVPPTPPNTSATARQSDFAPLTLTQPEVVTTDALPSIQLEMSAETSTKTSQPVSVAASPKPVTTAAKASEIRIQPEPIIATASPSGPVGSVAAALLAEVTVARAPSHEPAAPETARQFSGSSASLPTNQPVPAPDTEPAVNLRQPASEFSPRTEVESAPALSGSAATSPSTTGFAEHDDAPARQIELGNRVPQLGANNVTEATPEFTEPTAKLRQTAPALPESNEIEARPTASVSAQSGPQPQAVSPGQAEAFAPQAEFSEHLPAFVAVHEPVATTETSTEAATLNPTDAIAPPLESESAPPPALVNLQSEIQPQVVRENSNKVMHPAPTPANDVVQLVTEDVEPPAAPPAALPASETKTAVPQQAGANPVQGIVRETPVVSLPTQAETPSKPLTVGQVVRTVLKEDYPFAQPTQPTASPYATPVSSEMAVPQAMPVTVEAMIPPATTATLPLTIEPANLAVARPTDTPPQPAHNKNLFTAATERTVPTNLNPQTSAVVTPTFAAGITPPSTAEATLNAVIEPQSTTTLPTPNPVTQLASSPAEGTDGKPDAAEAQPQLQHIGNEKSSLRPTITTEINDEPPAQAPALPSVDEGFGSIYREPLTNGLAERQNKPGHRTFQLVLQSPISAPQPAQTAFGGALPNEVMTNAAPKLQPHLAAALPGPTAPAWAAPEQVISTQPSEGEPQVQSLSETLTNPMIDVAQRTQVITPLDHCEVEPLSSTPVAEPLRATFSAIERHLFNVAPPLRHNAAASSQLAPTSGDTPATATDLHQADTLRELVLPPSLQTGWATTGTVTPALPMTVPYVTTPALTTMPATGALDLTDEWLGERQITDPQVSPTKPEGVGTLTQMTVTEAQNTALPAPTQGETQQPPTYFSAHVTPTTWAANFGADKAPAVWTPPKPAVQSAGAARWTAALNQVTRSTSRPVVSDASAEDFALPAMSAQLPAPAILPSELPKPAAPGAQSVATSPVIAAEAAPQTNTETVPTQPLQRVAAPPPGLTSTPTLPGATGTLNLPRVVFERGSAVERNAQAAPMPERVSQPVPSVATLPIESQAIPLVTRTSADLKPAVASGAPEVAPEQSDELAINANGTTTPATVVRGTAVAQSADVRDINDGHVAKQLAEPLITASTDLETDAPRTIKLKLRPKELGQVEIELHCDATGRFNARLTVEREHTTQVLRNELGQLREALEQAGLQVGQLDITTGSEQPNGQAQGWHAGGQDAHHAHTTPTRIPAADSFDSEPVSTSGPAAAPDRLINLHA